MFPHLEPANPKIDTFESPTDSKPGSTDVVAQLDPANPTLDPLAFSVPKDWWEEINPDYPLGFFESRNRQAKMEWPGEDELPVRDSWEDSDDTLIKKKEEKGDLTFSRIELQLSSTPPLCLTNSLYSSILHYMCTCNYVQN